MAISGQSKEEEKLIHNQILDNYGKNHFIYYSDASCSPESLGIGISLAGYDQIKQTILKEYYTISKDKNTIYDGELEAIVRAIEHANRQTWKKEYVIIFSDSKAALQRLENLDIKAGQWQVRRAIIAAQELQEQGTRVTLQWVPAHQGLKGNEEADKLAKIASNLEPDDSYPISLACISQEIEILKINEWQNILENYDSKRQQQSTHLSYSEIYPWQIRSKPWVPRGVRKEVSSAFYQLKLGHGYFKSYMKRIGKSTTGKCRCGEEQDARHLLLDCRRYSQNRKRMKEKLEGQNMSLELLLHNKIGINITLEFLRETKILTRGWYAEEK